MISPVLPALLRCMLCPELLGVFEVQGHIIPRYYNIEVMSSRHHGTARQRRALAAFINLQRAANTIQSLGMKHLDQHGLTPSQFAVLEALYHVGPLCLSDLAQKILRTSGNLTMVVDNLEKSGYVKRVPSAEDRRYVRAEITDSGRRLIASIFPQHAATIADLMSRLSADEQETLRVLCRKLGKREQ
jgi:MarR family transcriptional regulator, 2-MHQ and catechol-resistance regulon repressor